MNARWISYHFLNLRAARATTAQEAGTPLSTGEKKLSSQNVKVMQARHFLSLPAKNRADFINFYT